MADWEMKRLKRRELLEMLLRQCQETERLQKELNKIREQHNEMEESYGRLKKKLDVKDERLNQKDAKITELRRQVAELKIARIRNPEEGALAEAVVQGAFEEARQAAERYLEVARSQNATEAKGQQEAGQEGRRAAYNPRKVTRIREKASVLPFAAASGGRHGR